MPAVRYTKEVRFGTPPNAAAAQRGAGAGLRLGAQAARGEPPVRHRRLAGRSSPCCAPLPYCLPQRGVTKWLDVWQPALAEFTFRTTFVPLTLAEAKAVVRFYRARYTAWAVYLITVAIANGYDVPYQVHGGQRRAGRPRRAARPGGAARRPRAAALPRRGLLHAALRALGQGRGAALQGAAGPDRAHRLP
jgi:hypothetical protein